MATRPDAPRAILIIRPSALGDVARTVPALVSLRRAFPDARIDWLVNDNFADVVRHHPDLNGVVEFPRKRFRLVSLLGRNSLEFLAFVRDLRRRKYDLVFDLQGLFRSGFLSRVSGAPLRYGEAGAREGAGLGHNRRFRCDAEHTVDRMLQVVAGAGVPIVRDMRLYVGESDRRWAGEQLAARGWAADRCLVLAPTARWASKRWPAESFIALARRVGDLALQGVVLLGGPNEQPQTRPIAAALGETCLDLTGRTSVGRMMAVIAAAGLVVANDSAALHIAVGLGRRCVGVFGPTDPRKVGPYRHEACVVRAEVQPGIHYRDSDDASIMASIGVQAVFERAARMLAAPPPELVHA